MAEKQCHMKTLHFLSKFLLTKTWKALYFQKKTTSTLQTSHKFASLLHERESLSDKTLVFDVEGALLKSFSVFPYLMHVAFEAGGILRALVLLLLYPIICMFGRDIEITVAVFVCFVGIKKNNFQIERTVLPKFFLEDVGLEVFDVMMRSEKKIGVTDMPRVMVEGFAKDYLGVEAVVGRELKTLCGYYVGLMEAKTAENIALNEIIKENKQDSQVIGIASSNKQQLFSHCTVVYFVNEAEKTNWQVLPREKYPKSLIFHDGRLAFRPTPPATLAMFIWIPFGIFLCIIRLIIAIQLPYKFSTPILSFLGMRGTLTTADSRAIPANPEEKSNGVLYVCNHKSLLDPVYISIALGKPLSAFTYSVSRISELLSPIKTIRLTRNREKDAKILEKYSKESEIVICPEGTTCREPYILRFSPLFAENMNTNIVPIAIDFQVSMFYGTTASGFKYLDPIFILMNPATNCSVKILDKLPKSFTYEKSKFEVANFVQKQIAQSLNFQSTYLTRKDKYRLLAGNEGVI